MRRGGWLLFVGGALLVNLGLLGLAPLLSHERERPEEGDIVSGVSLVTLKPPKPQEPEKVKEKPKPEPEPEVDFKPELMQPQFSGFGGLDAGIAVNLGGLGNTDLGGEFVFESYELDSPPEPVAKVPPIYPYKAREQGIEGVVQVKLLVRADGTVGQVLILAARPEGVFEDAVAKAVPQWRFDPGKVEGQPVTAWVTTAVRFEL